MLKRKPLIFFLTNCEICYRDYALPFYGNNLKKIDLERLERLQYRAAKLVTGAMHHTSKEKHTCELGWESIKKRTDFLGLSLFQNKPSFCSGSCDEIHATKLQKKLHLKILDTSLKLFMKFS